jgi:hypothetical protein
VTVAGKPILKSKTGRIFNFHSGSENNTIRFVTDSKFTKDDLAGLQIINEDKIIATIASVKERNADLTIRN